MAGSLKKVAFIPARSGSKRVKDKNIKELDGHPMMAYSIRAAIGSGIFDSVICATDSEQYAEIAKHYGAEVPFLRATAISGDKSPDIEWIVWALMQLKEMGRAYDVFSILRPTSPFRQADTIRRAWDAFIADQRADSLRAVEKCGQHPGKMWILHGKRMLPLMPQKLADTPWHSSQYVALPEIYVQNASLEIAWTRVPLENGSIAGEAVIPFVSQGYEGWDINEPDDFWYAERLVQTKQVNLPTISESAFRS